MFYGNSVASDLGLHCLLITLLGVSGLNWVNEVTCNNIMFIFAFHYMLAMEYVRIKCIENFKQRYAQSMHCFRQLRYLGQGLLLLSLISDTTGYSPMKCALTHLCPMNFTTSTF